MLISNSFLFRSFTKLAPNKIFHFDLNHFNKKLTQMTIYLSICSNLTHALIVSNYFIYGSDDNSILVHSTTLVAFIFALIKYISNFLFFYFFNKHFQIFVKNLPNEIKHFYNSVSDAFSYLLFDCILDRFLD